MKKINKLIIALSIGLGVSISSCQKLDIAPVNVLTDDIIFSSESGINSYLADIYRQAPMEDFTYRPEGRDGKGFNIHHEWEHFWRSGAVTGEMVGPYGGMDIGGGFGYWPYDKIRSINYMIQTLPLYTSKLTEAKVNQLTGEAYFLRAFFYFALAKRYGGVPIVKTVQNY
ncbi:MAG: RagB/SusD protein, partial [Daejeonella sp.]|nr:RagB/SusD protein [Daejeonella sp.]